MNENYVELYDKILEIERLVVKLPPAKSEREELWRRFLAQDLERARERAHTLTSVK